MTIIHFSIFAFLILCTAFFVATEFAIVKIRSSRIEQLVQEKKKGAKAAQKVVQNLDAYLSACQLGITITALGIGMVGESTFEVVLHPLFEWLHLPTYLIGPLTVFGAFAMATFAHVVIGELAPKTIAINKAESVVLLLAKPLILFHFIMYPFIWFLNGSARFLTGLFGFKLKGDHDSAHTEEELKILLSESYRNGEINEAELTYMKNVFEFDDLIARKVMIPRTEIVSISLESSLEEILQIISTEEYTRYPVVDGNKDNIIGFLNAKQFLISYYVERQQEETFDIQNLIQPVLHVIDNVSVHELLKKMQKEAMQLAILIDEFGGTSGLITVEDILEELVGEIRDEFDKDEQPEVIKNEHTNEWTVDGKTSVSKMKEHLSIDFTEEADTMGGWFLTKHSLLHLSPQDDRFDYEGYQFSVEKFDGIHVEQLIIRPLATTEMTNNDE